MGLPVPPSSTGVVMPASSSLRSRAGMPARSCSRVPAVAVVMAVSGDVVDST